jgi:outer membrane protein OmpA-like peptidoglycan-associated protein
LPGRRGLGLIQRKVLVGPAGDHHEREADRVADAILDGSAIGQIGEDAARIARRCPGGCPTRGGCDDTERLQRSPESEPAAPDSRRVDSAVAALRDRGRPLSTTDRAFFEGRFGRDFSTVRVHTGELAAEATRLVSARAFTIGNDIAFGQGQYAPGTQAGKHLLAHELAHTLQQRGVAGWLPTATVQRAACPPTPTGLASRPIEPARDCPESGSPVKGAHLRFCTDSVVLKDETELRLPRLLSLLKKQATIPIHGYASREGPRGHEAAYNLNLSCRRANRVAEILTAAGIPRSKLSLYKHGGTAELGGDDENRAVVIPITGASRFRVAVASFLACAPCNPYTDDTAAVALTPPATEPAASGFGYRQLHWLEGEVRSADGMTIDSATVIDRGASAGHSGYCGQSDPAAVLATGITTGVRLPGGPATPESYLWAIQMSTRVNADVPATLPGSPCGPLGTNSGVPPIGNRVLLRVSADGTFGSSFVTASTYPFHYLYEDRALKMFGGSPVHPVVNFPAWATAAPMLRLIASMGFAPLKAAEIGFSALRYWCCNPTLARLQCPTICSGGVTVPHPVAVAGGIISPPSIPAVLASCGSLVGLLAAGCHSSCAPAGAACPTPSIPANP